jgi:hypothetical protein
MATITSMPTKTISTNPQIKGLGEWFPVQQLNQIYTNTDLYLTHTVHCTLYTWNQTRFKPQQVIKGWKEVGSLHKRTN